LYFSGWLICAQEAYCNMLVKYREELTRPIDEAMEFLKRVEAQLDSIAGAAVDGGSSAAARLSLTGNEKKHQLLLLLQLAVQRLLLLVHGRTAASCFFITICALGLPHWEWLFWISGGGCPGSLPL
jgi:hypothetical protein